MSDSEVLERLKKIERRQINAGAQFLCAFGLAVTIMGYNFLREALQIGDITQIVSTSILLILGFVMMLWGLFTFPRKEKCKEK